MNTNLASFDGKGFLRPAEQDGTGNLNIVVPFLVGHLALDNQGSLASLNGRFERKDTTLQKCH
jgi:hypothetical protein